MLAEIFRKLSDISTFYNGTLICPIGGKFNLKICWQKGFIFLHVCNHIYLVCCHFCCNGSQLPMPQMYLYLVNFQICCYMFRHTWVKLKNINWTFDWNFQNWWSNLLRAIQYFPIYCNYINISSTHIFDRLIRITGSGLNKIQMFGINLNILYVHVWL